MTHGHLFYTLGEIQYYITDFVVCIVLALGREAGQEVGGGTSLRKEWEAFLPTLLLGSPRVCRFRMRSCGQIMVLASRLWYFLPLQLGLPQDLSSQERF